MERLSKRTIILIISWLILVSVLYYFIIRKIQLTTPAKITSKTGFRNTLWGMNKEQVKSLELCEFYEEVKEGGTLKGLDTLVYDHNIGDMDGVPCYRLNAVICYYFARNYLTRARYLITQEYANLNFFIDDFNYIKSKLIEKYGFPEKDDEVWLNNLHKDKPSEYGFAVSIGHLQYVAEWHPAETTIQLILHGDNNEVSLWVEYKSDALRQFETQVIKKAKENIW